MDREAVASGTLRSVGYDPHSLTLEVEFQDGGVFRYAAVPEFLYRGIMLAKSKGAFFNTRVLGRYNFERVK